MTINLNEVEREIVDHLLQNEQKRLNTINLSFVEHFKWFMSFDKIRKKVLGLEV